MNRALGLVALSLFALTACVVEPGTGDEGSSDESDMSPDVAGKAILPVQGYAASGGASGKVTNAITNHGGPVMTSAINVYLIWYGAFDGASGHSSTTYQGIVKNFAGGIGASPYWNIAKTYKNTAGTAVSGTVTVAGETSVSSGYKTSLSDADIQTIVSTAISGGLGPAGGDVNGVYFVMTSQDVNASSGFCTQYCGWHTHGTIGGKDIKYSFVGDANRCLSGCAAQATGPNGDPGADGAASIFAHELEETASDPDLNGWYDRSGAENGDKCAWTFGTQSTASNGSKYNLTVGGKQYLVQQNWSAATQACGMQ